MSVNLQKRQNLGILAALIIGTVAVMAAGIIWLQGQGTTLIEEFAYAIFILVVGLFLYDKLLVM